MTSNIIFASNRLGVIDNDQLQAMLDKFKLGTLISFEKTANGAMGQTLFVTATEGNFVFKGNPLYEGQLREERFFIENLHKRTTVPVPMPYCIDDSGEIFQWNYALMPRLIGNHLNTIDFTANPNEKFVVAELIAKTLLEFHSWKATDFGDLNTFDFSINPFEKSYKHWLFNRIMFWLEDAKKYSKITTEDIWWVENLLKQSEDVFEKLKTPTFIMGDFKPGNFLIFRKKDRLEISGVFDFTNSYFADPLSDLIKMVTYYIDENESDVAEHLIKVYFAELNEDIETVIKRMNVHMLHQRILDWGCAKAMNMVTWDNNLPFYKWMEFYTNSVVNLLKLTEGSRLFDNKKQFRS